MTLDQLRIELERGATREGVAQPVLSAIGDSVATKLHRIAIDREGGVRLQLPHTQMPVLP